MTAAFADLDRAHALARDKQRRRLRVWHVAVLLGGMATLPLLLPLLFPTP